MPKIIKAGKVLTSNSLNGEIILSENIRKQNELDRIANDALRASTVAGIEVTYAPQLSALLSQMAEKANDADVVKTVNGVTPDVAGNVVVEAGGGGTSTINDMTVAQDSTWSSSKIENVKANKAQQSWIEPTLVNGWAQTSSGERARVAYMKDEFGFIHIKGEMSGGNGDVLFTLPVGYRPERTQIMSGRTYASFSPKITDFCVAFDGIISTFPYVLGQEYSINLAPFKASGV